MAYRIPSEIGFEPGRSQPRTFDGRGYAEMGAAFGDLVNGINAEQAKKEDERAVDLLVKEQAAYEPEYRARAEAYDGQEPGFALAEGKHWESRLNGLIEGAGSDGLRQALIRRGKESVRGVISHATNVEAERRAEPVRQARLAQETSLLLDGDIAFNDAYTAKVKPIYDGFDGTQADLAGRVLPAFDEAMEAVRPTIDHRVLPQWEAAMAARRAKEFATASTIEQKGQEGVVLRNVTDKGRVLVNQLQDNPALFDENYAALDKLVDTLPAALRPDTRRELRSGAVRSLVLGMVTDGQGEEAEALIASGRFDDVLDPEDKAGLIKYAANKGKSDFELATAQIDAKSRAEAALDDVAQGGPGDQISLAEINATLGGEYGAAWQKQRQLAERAGGAVRALPEMRTEDVVKLANSQAPDPDTPDYLVQKKAWETSRAAAAEELKLRQADAGAWALRTSKPGDVGDQLQQRFTAIDGAADARGRAAAANSYKNLMIWRQEAAGLDPAAWRLTSKAQAAARVQALNAATPENRAATLKAQAAWVNAFPATARDNTGRLFSPRGMVVRELQAAGLKPMEAAAIIDFGDNPAQMDALAAAMSYGPATMKLPDSKDEKRVVEAVDRALGPYLESAAPMPGARALEEPRRATVRVLARHLILTQHMSPQEAAKAASAAYTSDYVFDSGMRLPKGEKGAVTGLFNIREQIIKGDLLMPAGSRGQQSGRQSAFTGDFVKRYGRWTTNPDDSGATLMAPVPDGTWTPVLDKWGRPIVASWGDARQALRDPYTAVGPAKPPPPPPKADRLAPPVRPKAETFNALAAAVERQETGGTPQQISHKGAIGAMQLMPSRDGKAGTAELAARRLGLPYDEKRLLTDHDYNRKLGREELRFQYARWGEPVLALVAYNAGPGVLEPTYTDSKGRKQVGWLVRFGDPRKGQITWDQWVARIPYDETRNYVRKIMPDAYRRLK